MISQVGCGLSTSCAPSTCTFTGLTDSMHRHMRHHQFQAPSRPLHLHAISTRSTSAVSKRGPQFVPGEWRGHMCIADCCGEELMRALSQLSRCAKGTSPEGGSPVRQSDGKCIPASMSRQPPAVQCAVCYSAESGATAVSVSADDDQALVEREVIPRGLETIDPACPRTSPSLRDLCPCKCWCPSQNW